VSTVCQMLHKVKAPTPPHTKISSPSTWSNTKPPTPPTMLGSKMRVLFAIKASKPVFQSRAFTSTSIHHKEFTDPFASFSPSDTPELVTPEGLRSINKYTAAHPTILSARLQNSSEDPHARNFNLLFTPKNLMTMTLLTNSSWRTQVAAALEIVRREQRLALVRAGIPVSLCFLFSIPHDGNSSANFLR
jgi:hypothetical protein